MCFARCGLLRLVLYISGADQRQASSIPRPMQYAAHPGDGMTDRDVNPVKRQAACRMQLPDAAAAACASSSACCG